MFQSPFIRIVLLVSIAAIILFPLYTIFVQHPAFTRLLTDSTTLEAERVATTLSAVLSAGNRDIAAGTLPSGFQRYVKILLKDSRIVKLKIYSPDGKILYSTDPLEIGLYNEEDYFHRIMETGGRRSRQVDRNGRSLEKQIMSSDVVETYVPITAEGGRIIGVLEVYYNITPEKDRLHRLTDRATTTMFVLALLLLGAVVYAANKTWRTTLEGRRTEEALVESEKRYRTLFENAADAIFIIEAEGEDTGRIVAANKAASHLHGYSLEEMTSMKITDLDTEESARAAPGLIRSILAGEWIKTELMHRKKDGRIFPVEVSAGLLELGGHRYILAFDRDITERRQTEQGREKLIHDLQEALDKIRTLKGLIPICSSCKKIRDDKGYWNQLEAYISAHTEADFSHSLCPDCVDRLFPGMKKREKPEET